MIEVTVILPAYNERENLAPLLDEIEQALTPTGYVFEIIVVDDGSTDGSGVLLRELARIKPHLKVITFRANYGQSSAFDAGFRAAAGRFVATLDADGQNDPADLPRMLGLLEHDEYDFVIGFRSERQDALLLRKLPSRAANFLIRKVTGTRLRDLGCSLKVYRRELTDEVHLYGEMHRFLGVLVESLGARTVEVPVHHRRRASGRSKYGLARTFKVLLDLVTVWFMRGYQTKPIYVFGGAGLLFGFTATALSAVVLGQKLLYGVWVHRNPLFTISMIFSVMAVQFLGLGLLAEIAVRTYFESQGKTSYLVANKIGFETESSARRPTLTHLGIAGTTAAASLRPARTRGAE
jgi:glycosyltransferase involved in cell wall biosynthesis